MNKNIQTDLQRVVHDSKLEKAIRLHQDSEVWKAFKNGDKESYAFIFSAYKDILYSYGLTIFSEESLVNDCIQELFLEIWVKKHNLADVHCIKYYLIKSLRRLIIHKKTENKKLLSNHFLRNYVINENVNSYESDLIYDQIQREQSDKLTWHISKLPKRQKEVIYLRFYQKMSYEEITSVTNLSYKSVRNHVYLAIQTLRKELHAKDYTFATWLLPILWFAYDFVSL